MKSHKELAIQALTHFNMNNDFGLYLEEQPGDLFGADQMKEFRLVLYRWQSENHSNIPVLLNENKAIERLITSNGKKIYAQWSYKTKNFPTEKEIIEETYLKFNFAVMRSGLQSFIDINFK